MAALRLGISIAVTGGMFDLTYYSVLPTLANFHLNELVTLAFHIFRRARTGTTWETDLNDVCCVEVYGTCCVTLYSEANMDGKLQFLEPGFVGQPFLPTIKSVAVYNCDKLRHLL